MSAASRYDVVGTGSMVVDLICTTPRFVGEDEKVLLEPQDAGPVVRRLVGGVTLNHMGWASILGLRAALFGKQGDDPEGRLLRAGMARLGIAQHLDLSGSASSLAHVYVDGRGGRAIYMARGATGELSADEIETRHRGVIESAPLVTSEVSQVPLAAVKRVLEIARAAGARTVVDLDVPIADAVPVLGSEQDLHAVLERADVIKASVATLAGIVRTREPEAIADELAKRYHTNVIALTLGADGAALFAEGKRWREPAPPVEVVDTTGAGDAFLGGLLAALHHGLGWGDGLKLATSAGACCCERAGGFPDDPEACRARTLELHAQAGGAPLPAAAASWADAASDRATERFLRIACDELGRAAREIDVARIRAAADLIRSAAEQGGRLHLTGVGKPEHVARYAAALLSSTGTPAVFLHGTEATHGGVGQLRPGDVLIAISNSGETSELLASVAAARGMDARIVAVTGRADSSLARAAELVLEAGAEEEGGPLGLAPRASTLTQTLVLQALSVELQAARSFDRRDYHARHPHGTLGALSKRG